MNFGTNWKSFLGEITKEEAEKIFDLYVSKGGNFIDTANVYQDGESELWLGEWIAKRGIRDDLVLASKYSLTTKAGVVNKAGNHRKNMFSAIDETLKRLQTHYIDIYYVHFWDHTTSVEELMRALDDLVRSGKVHYVAISDAPAWQVSRANMLAELRGWSPFVAYQGKYNLGERDFEREITPMSTECELALIPWAVLGQGKYTGKFKKGEQVAARGGVTMTDRDYLITEEVVKIAAEINRTPSQVCLNWMLQKPGTFPLLGCRKLEQLQDNLSALEFNLSPEHVQRLNTVSEFEIGFPNNFIGSSYQTCRWLKKAGVLV